MIEELEAPESARAEPRPRRRLPWSMVAAGLAVAGALAYLIFASTSANAAAYLSISQVRACHDCTTRAVRIAGEVAAGSIQRDDATQTVRFTLTQGTDSLPVSYRGVLPDIFRPGITVVVEGKMTSAGQFQAQTLLAKCPSKFQSATLGAS